jgi:hypothetical protein
VNENETTAKLIEACMKQADFAAGRFDVRRGYQWKVTLGLWTALLLANGKLWGSGFRPPVWIGGVILVCYAMLWVRGVYVGNKNDRTSAYHFRDEAEKFLLDRKSVV